MRAWTTGRSIGESAPGDRRASRPHYPFWIALIIDSGAVGAAAVAVLQRIDTGAALPALALMLVALVPFALEIRELMAPWPLFVLVTGGPAVVLMVRYPVEYDFAPFLLVMLAGCIGAYAPMLHSGAALLVTLGLLGVTTALDGLPPPSAAIWLAAIMVGWDVGFVMRSQQLRIQQQARESADRARRAAVDERQRIAREVHDLVAHSLSVTMLHLTAARRDLEEGGEVAEAVDALREAERVGRQAVADVRRTVGLLGQGNPVDAPAPGVCDIPRLVEDFRSAGLQVDLAMTGDLDQVPPTTALGLYRVVQESLANVARHAPTAPVSVRLDLDGDPGTLVVSNPLPRGWSRGAGGSGLRGMAERAGLLGARLYAGPGGGPAGSANAAEWVVRVELPRGDTAAEGTGGRACPLPRLIRAGRRTLAEQP